MAHIDYYMFPISPFTYLAGDGLEKVAEKHGATITYKPFNLMQVFAQTGGTPVPERHPSRQAYRLAEIERIAKMQNLPVNVQPAHFPTNPAPASYAIIAAQEAGGGDVGGLCRTLLSGVWAEEKDISDDAVVKAAVEANGFDAGLADSGMLTGAQTFEKNTEDAIQAQAFGAPSYVVDGHVFWGGDRLNYLDAHLSTG